MDIYAAISTIFSGFLTAAELGIATWMFVCHFERRKHFYIRFVAIVVLVICACLLAPAGATPEDFEKLFLIQIAGFTALLPVLIVIVLFLFNASIWNSLYACIMAYTMQNLAYGLFSFAYMIVGNFGFDVGDMRLNAFCSIIAMSAVYAICYFTLIKKIDANHLSASEDKPALLAFVVVLLVAVVFDMILKTLPILGVPYAYIYALRIVHAAVCIFMLYAEYEMLYNKRLQADAATLESLVGASERQYKMSRENIEAINIKCHDLKHQIRELREGGATVSDQALNEIEHAVGIYDAVIKTGNDALDTILTEKSLLCEQEDITLSCIADGSALGNIAPSDLYSLFGNILDNAIEAARNVGDTDRRTIGLTVRQVLGMTAIHAENFYAGEVKIQEGLPLTTKRRTDGSLDTANHGFGMQSIGLIAQRYGGSMKCNAQDGLFTLDILLSSE